MLLILFFFGCSSVREIVTDFLVRDLDGTTFCYTLYDAISPRIKFTTSFDRAALSIFRSTLGERPLRKGTFIFLTWLHPFKMNISLTSAVSTSFLLSSYHLNHRIFLVNKTQIVDAAHIMDQILILTKFLTCYLYICLLHFDPNMLL